MTEILLVNVSGPDRPGITRSVSQVLAEHGATILDIGQAVIHDTLNLGLLAGVPRRQEVGPAMEELRAALRALGLEVRFEPVTAAAYEHWVGQQGKPRHIVTLLGRTIRAAHIARVTGIIAAHGLNIDKIARLSGRVPLQADGQKSNACVEFSVRGETPDLGSLRASLLELAAELDIDIAYQEDSIFRRHRRLVAFDMDSTLIENEVIDELARRAGVGEQVAAITERAMRGELDFQSSFRARVALLKGLPEAVLDEVYLGLTLTEGAERLIATLKKLGYKTAILSGGFTCIGRRIQERLGIDYLFANELEIVGGVVTGEARGPIVDAARKAQLLRELAAREGISLEQTIAVGDGANDLLMLAAAGLGIAFRAKPLVRASAQQAISQLGLDGILYLMGISDRDARFIPPG
ncbi:MAG: phosphoserine phosphatase SerB [Pseudomonadota bacterium]|jgi:phosphoserine phosphatase